MTPPTVVVWNAKNKPDDAARMMLADILSTRKPKPSSTPSDDMTTKLTSPLTRQSRSFNTTRLVSMPMTPVRVASTTTSIGPVTVQSATVMVCAARATQCVRFKIVEVPGESTLEHGSAACPDDADGTAAVVA